MAYWLEPPGPAGRRRTRVFRAGDVTFVVSPIPVAPLLNSIITATAPLRLNMFMNGQMLLLIRSLQPGMQLISNLTLAALVLQSLNT